jgi:hypothetical protein
VEKHVRKYGDAALIAELTKTVNTHSEASALFSAEVADSLAQIVEAAERYIKNESARLAATLERLEAKVPEFRELGRRGGAASGSGS